MKLLRKELVSLDYRQQLQQDLARASICRFLVAYISPGGIESIGRHLLTRALRDDRSFGVGSLSCSCGYDPLIHLQREMPELRLKYFMDPLVKKEEGEASQIALFHSKLVYLYLEREVKSVVYIGSHNWTRRALGPRGTRNAEASMRFELEFVAEDLDGSGTSVASDVNGHLLDAWNMPACLPAVPTNEQTFHEWYEKGCRRSQSARLDEITVLLAVCRGGAVGVDWLALDGKGIYLQVLDEDDGDIVWRSDNRLLVMVWESEADLAAARQPVLLDCAITTSKAGPDSRLRGTNQSRDPVVGFQAVIWDDAELLAQQNARAGRRPRVRLWSRREAQVYDFEFPTARTDSSQVDGTARPKYQFYLEVERVVMPTSGTFQRSPEFVWSPDSFSVVANRDAARMEETPGYFVEPEREREIMASLTELFCVDPSQAKVLPYSSADRLKEGKRISTHPLHETFLGPEWKEKTLRDEYYRQSEAGALVAELDDTPTSESPVGDYGPEEILPRLQRVFTTPLSKLSETWSNAARMLRLRREGLQ